MKNLVILILLLLGTVSSYAQDQEHEHKRGKKSITVQGRAEMEVIPDILYFRIALKEYKDGNQKKELNELEKELVKAINKLGLPKENLQVENVYGYNWDYKKKKPDEFLATKSFILKLTDLKQINELMSSLDPEGVNQSGINSYTHSKLEEYKLQLKVDALKAAKSKAELLLGAINENVGEALNIQEMDYGATPKQLYYTRSDALLESDGYQSTLEFKTIKITAEIQAEFAIK